MEISQERGQTSRELRRHSQKIKLFREKLIFAVEFRGGLGRDEREGKLAMIVFVLSPPLSFSCFVRKV